MTPAEKIRVYLERGAPGETQRKHSVILTRIVEHLLEGCDSKTYSESDKAIENAAKEIP